MKKIFTITSFLLFIINVLAQQIPDNKIDSLLINIDKSTLTSNILYERVFSWAGLATFNDSLNVSNTSHFEQASNQEKFISYKDYRSLYTNKKIYNTVDIGITNAKRNFLGNYHKIKGKYLQLYLNEFVYKLNRRYFGEKIFDRLIIASITVSGA